MSFLPLSSYLMNQPILIMLILAHFISDFVLQNQTLADNKKEQFSALLVHLFLVATARTARFAISPSKQ